MQELPQKTSEWQPFKFSIFGNSWLLAGYKVKLTWTGEVGIVTKRLRKNFEVFMDGKKYSVRPADISEFMIGNFISEVANASEPFVSTAPQTRTDLGEQYFHEDTTRGLSGKIGDVALFYRGHNNFDIAKITKISSNDIHGILLNGRAAGKSFKWKTKLYIQTINSVRVGNVFCGVQ